METFPFYFVFALILLCGNGADGMSRKYNEKRRKYADKVLLVSMDGFRWDYIDKTNTPNFDKLARLGIKVPYIDSTFISKTFPSHYSMATGLYEESHGIVGNVMYDPVFREIFTMSTKDSKWWNGGEPIWVTLRKNSKRSAIFFWPGSESEIRGYRPNIWKVYNGSIPYKDRIDTVIGWLTDRSKITNFAALYFDEPDSTGHKYGPDSEEVLAMVREMDGFLGYLLDEFDKHNLWKSVNMMVTSDHGMTSVDYQNKMIDISDYIDIDTVYTVDGGPIMHISPKSTDLLEQVYQNLTGKPHFTVYKKEDIPEYWHYRNNRRVNPLFAVADEGWTISKNREASLRWSVKGAHGYDNRLDDMKPIFFARGPNFRRHVKTDPFQSVDIYPMICELLGVRPAPNNGSLCRVYNLLREGHFDG